MTYELAKKLKDAGYPQKTVEHYATEELKVLRIHFWFDDSELVYPNNLIYRPTLSELIEACGKYFSKLQKSQLKRTWTATWRHHMSVSKTKYRGISRTGKTPAEAVARLWLALNTGE